LTDEVNDGFGKDTGSRSGDGESDADWGFSTGSKGMSKETKIGLALIVVLLSALGFVVWKKWEERSDLLAQAGKSAVKKSKTPDAKLGAAALGSADDDPFGDSGNSDFLGDQNEPDDSGSDFGRRDDDFGGGSDFADGQSRRTDDFGSDFGDSSSTADDFGDSRRSEFGDERVGSSGARTASFNGGDFGDTRDADNSFDDPADDDFGSGRSSRTASDDREFGSFDDASTGRTSTGRGRDSGFGDDFGSDDRSDFGSDDDTMDTTGSSRDDFGSGSSSFDDGDDSDDFGDTRSSGFDDGTSAGSRTTVRRDDFGDDSNSFDDSNDFGSSRTTESSSGFGDDSSSSGFGSDDDRIGTSRSSDPFDERGSSRLGSRSTFEDSSSGGSEYVVQPGDNYWSISRKLYGTSKHYMALAKANASRIPDPAKMRPGMRIVAPSIESLGGRSTDDRRTASRETRFGSDDRSSDSTSDDSGAAGYFTGSDGEPRYRVGSRDTLSDIAQKHLGRGSRWVQLYSMNRQNLSDPNRLTIGTILHLPSDASRVRLVQRRGSFR
jgi:hypothetical protein